MSNGLTTMQLKQPLIYDEFINPNNILSLENFEDNHENYVLKAPRKGKIIKGPVCTAYKRQNLGSIPRKTENILIDELKIPKTTKGFSSQLPRFANTYTKSEAVKLQFPGPGSYTIEKKFDFVTSDTSHHSSKGFGNGFASNTSRFGDYKEFYDKYLPGPGSYKSDESTSMISTLNKTLSYKSLYNKASTKPLKLHPQIPGPCSYNPILLNKKSDFAEGENFYFKSEIDRFKKVPKSALGPGRYFKDDIDFAITKSPNKGKTYVNSAYINLENEGDFGNKTTSYFFKKNPEKTENLIDDYIKTSNPLNARKIKTPGPGTYEIKKDHNSNWNFTNPEKKESLYVETLKLNKFKRRLNTAANIKPRPLLEMNLAHLQTIKKIKDEKINSANINSNNNNGNNNKNNNIFSTNGFGKGQFKSNNLDVLGGGEDENGYEINVVEKVSSPQKYPDYFIKRNIPGPAYYNPIKKPVKVNFNWNLEKKWI